MRRKLKWTLLTLMVLILGTVGYYTYSFYHFAKEIETKPKDSKFKRFETDDTVKYEPPKWEGAEKVNILLLGGDSRGLEKNEVPRSDSIMVATLDPVTKKAYLFSILRDTYVDIPDHGKNRINTALSMGGPKLAMKTVSELLNIPVQYYVYTDFKGFIALIDSIGGIDFEVEKDMHYSDPTDHHIYDIDLKKGMQHLDGKQALQYVRFRHDAMSDFTRTGRQRSFLQAVAQKLQTTSSLIKLPKILNAVDPYIETNLSVTNMLKLGTLAYESKAAGFVSEQLPPLNLIQDSRVNGASVLTVDEQALQDFVRSKYEETATGTGAPNSTTPNQVSSGTNTVTDEQARQ